MHRRFIYSRIYSNKSIVITTINDIPLIDRPDINIWDLRQIPEEAKLIGINGYTLKLYGESYQMGKNLCELRRNIDHLSYDYQTAFPNFRLLRIAAELRSIPILHRNFIARIYMIDYCDKIDPEFS